MKRSVGSEVKVKTSWPIEERRNIRGVLQHVDEENITVLTDEAESFVIPVAAIKNARLNVDLNIKVNH